MRKKRSRWVIILVVIAAIIVYGFISIRAGQKKKAIGVEVDIDQVKVGEIITVVTGTGLVEAEDKVEVRAEISGLLASALIKEGDWVNRGELLFQFDDRQLRQVVASAEAGVEMTRAELENLAIKVREVSSGGLQIKQAEQSLAQARLALTDAEKNYARINGLYQDGAAAKEQLEAAASAVEDAGLRVKQAETMLDQAILSDKTDEGREKLLRLKLKDAQRSLAEAQEELAKTKVRATQSGRVLLCPVKEGMTVPAGTELCRIGRIDRLQVILPVDEIEITQVKIGQKATITHLGLPELKLTGAVEKIALQAVERGGQSVFQVEIGLSNQEDLLRPGMSVDTEILTNHLTGVLTLPLLAVLEEENEQGVAERYVFLAQDEKAVKTKITTGLSSDSAIEVTGGISEGEPFVAGDYDTILHIKDGSNIREKKESKEKESKS